MTACRYLRGPAWLGLVVLATVLLGCSALGQSVPAVATDRADYFPGDTVLIAGTGFHAGEQVTLQVVHIDGTPNTGDGHLPWIVTTDELGDFQSFWFVPYDDSLGSAFKLTADCPDGLHAEATFTDGQPHWVQFQTSGLPSGVSVTVTYQYTNPGGQPNSGSVTFTSPGPSSSHVSTDPGASFSYVFPATVTVGSTVYTLKSSSPSSPFTTGNSGDTTTVTGTYEAAPTNRPPVASNDSYTVAEDATLSVAAPGVLANDSDPDGNPITAVLVTGVSHGSLTLNSNGSFSYTPSANYNGSDSFTYKASDGSLYSNVATVSITVTPVNDPPTLTVDNASVTVDEGDTATNSGTWSDPDGDTLTLSASVGTVTLNGDGTWSWSWQTTDGPTDSQTVTISADDGNGGSASVTFDLTVNNVAPTVTAPADQTADEGTAKSFDLGSFSDPGVNDSPWSVDVDWGDGSAHTTFSATAQGSLGNQSHTYADNGVYTVTVKVTDKDGGSGSASFNVTVANVAPTVTAPADQTADEGTAKSFDLGSFSDPGVNDSPWSVDVDWGDGSAHTTFSTNAQGSLGNQSHTYADNGVYTVTVKVTDKDGGSGSASLKVTVVNLPPTVGSITVTPTPPVAVNTAVDASAGFTDPGTADTHTASWDWGDGTTSSGTVTESAGSGTAAGSHTYTTPGIYTVTLTVTDKDGGHDQEIYQYVVVYDPYGGFVTGGGWIISPLGAYAPDPTLTGKATFGFVSKYQKGASTPVGQTEFQFKVANLNFHSTSYEWLVVAGSKAIYKGEGTINGVGGYGFILSAIDGDKKPDAFRIKIWDKATGVVVYDNQMGATQDADPTTVLAGGSIVIHK